MSDAAHATVKDSAFLTTYDSIYCNAGSIDFSGTNYLGADVIKGSTATCTLKSNCTFDFINNGAITIQCTMEGNNSFVFSNSALVHLDGVSNLGQVTSITLRPDGLVGDTKDVATGYGSVWTGATEVYYDNKTTGQTEKKSIDATDGVALADNKLTATVTARGLIANKTLGNADTNLYVGKNVEFRSDLSTYFEKIGTVVAGGEKVIAGRGTASTTLQGTLFADGNGLSMSGLTYQGVVYGANTTGSTATNTSLVFDGMAFDSSTVTSRIYGGGKVASDEDTLNLGSVDVAIGSTSAVTMGAKTSVYGAGYVKGSNSKLETMDIQLDINAVTVAGTTSGSVYGGAYVDYIDSADETSTVKLGTVTTTIRGGHFKFAGNGSYVYSTVSESNITQGHSSLTISGGIFEGCVYAGGYSRAANSATVNDGCALVISGGTFGGYVFGGCAANNSSECNKTSVTGDINVTIDGGTGSGNAISFAKSLFAGSMGNGVHNKGSNTVTLTGNLSNVSWAANAALYGSNQWMRTETTTTRKLVLDDAYGTFGAYMKDTFTDAEITADGTAKTLTFSNSVGNIVVLDSISTWTLDKDASLVWECTGSCDLANDTLILNDYEVAAGSPATLLDLGSNNLTGWGSQTVKFRSNTATRNDAAGVITYTWGVYTLSKVGNSIQLAANA